MTKKPRKGTSVRFSTADGIIPPDPPDPLLGLRFTIEARYGGFAEIDYTDQRPRAIAIAFAGALRRQAGLGGALGSRSTIIAHRNTYRRFFAYLREHSSASTPAELKAEDVEGFESFLQASGKRPIHLFIQLSHIIQALRSIDSDRPDLLNTRLRERLSYTSARSAGRSKPRDAYSPFVAKQLRDAARADIGDMFRRIGAPLEDSGDAVINAAAALVEAKIIAYGRVSHTDPDLRRLWRMRNRHNLPVSNLAADIHARHHLSARDIPALLTFLSLETGLEIECCKALKVNCLRNANGTTVELTYEKRRARGAEHKSMRIRDGAITTPGGLIRKIIDVTAFARRFAASDNLWIYHYAGKSQFRSGIEHIYELTDGWVKRSGVVDDDQQPLQLLFSRLRKTHKALWYLKTEGHMARFAVGHTPEVAARHYADIPSLRPLHEETVAAALTEVVASAGPIVLSPDDIASLRAGTTVLPRIPDVAAVIEGDQDVWLASCANFEDSPYAAAGSPCTQPFLGCLECRNAVITERKLPALLAFLNFVEEARSGLSPTAWTAKFGRAHHRITRQILPAFPDASVAKARNEAVSVGLYLPPEARL
jgi:hypothetical protein